MNAAYVEDRVKQKNVDVKVSRMELVTVMVMYSMNAVNVVALASQMISVIAREM